MSSAVTTQVTDLQNYVNGAWRRSTATEYFDVANPATAELLARTPLSSSADVDAAVQAAADAFPAWRRTPPGERVQYLFKLKNLLEENLDDLARVITLENGKTFAEARAELRRAIENVEVACGIPMMMQGYNLEDVTPGVDEMQIRQPLGVLAAIVPFNFPAMVSYWFLPYAIACGNTFILKPSERVPLSMHRAFELLEKTGLPKGVVNLVNGGKEVVNALCDHPQVRAISFVGSTPVARHVYTRSAASGKRMQCQGGAKNHEIRIRKFPHAHGSGRFAFQQPARPYGNFRARAQLDSRQFYRRSHGISSPQSLRQPGLALYDQRFCRAQIPLRSSRREYRHQYRRCRPHGLFPLQRLERKLFRHSSRSGTRRR